MKYLYYCNSAYQLVNILNLNWQRKFNNYESINNYEADLIVLDAFNGANEIVEALANSDLFNNVTLINRVKNKGLLHSISTLLDIFIPIRYINKAGKFVEESITNTYDYICVPKISRITFSIWLLNKKAKIQLYEEGMGTYYGGKHMCYEYNTHQGLYKFLNNGKDFSNYESIYVNNPSLYLDSDTEKVIQIPKFDIKCLDYLRDLFKNILFKDPNKKVFWIGQYLKDEMNKSINDSLIQCSNDVVFCPHPRIKMDINKDFSVLNNRIWELGLLNISELDNRCFVSGYSTAVFSPKLLYDKEPYLILTINLIHSDDEHFKTMAKIIDRFKETYKDKDKIMLPSNDEELKECVKKIMMGQ